MSVHSKLLSKEIEDLSISEHVSVCIDSMKDFLVLFVNLFFAIATGMLYFVANTIFVVWDNTMTLTNKKRMIKDPTTNDDYLLRYYILFKDRPEWFPVNLFVHKFISSDMDKPHNHPWGYFTIILSGGYWEYIYSLNDDGKIMSMEKYWRKPGFYQMVGADHTHRIELDSNKTCWTLFIPFTRTREWKFIDDAPSEVINADPASDDKADFTRDSGDGNYKEGVVDFSNNVPDLGNQNFEDEDNNGGITSYIFGNDSSKKTD